MEDAEEVDASAESAGRKGPGLHDERVPNSPQPAQSPQSKSAVQAKQQAKLPRKQASADSAELKGPGHQEERVLESPQPAQSRALHKPSNLLNITATRSMLPKLFKKAQR
jgi:hypothetical protein